MNNYKVSEGLADLCYLDTLTEESVLNNLQLRFQKDSIYTRIGEQIISINPFNSTSLDSIIKITNGSTQSPQRKENITNKNNNSSSTKVDQYSQQSKLSFRNKYMYECNPHIYALAEDTYKQLLLTKENQCIIITGESGAGKTEASKIFMDYISFYCYNNIEKDNIMNKIIECNILLEAFGNAKTIRNDNSSRFGKFITIQCDGRGVPIGGKINQYLIEKSRINTRAQGERSFHIFYQFLTSKPLTTKFQMSDDPSFYRCLRESACYTTDVNNDATLFKLLLESLVDLGWSVDEQDVLWRMISAVLLIGNIDFESDTEKSTVDAVVINNPDVLKKVASLLQCDADVLEKSLISRSLTTGAGKRASSIRVLLDQHQAGQARDALARVLYERLFEYILDRINHLLQPKASSPTSAPPLVESMIGILDIYGFEVFENNSFEQFIINYANEKLQQLFIQLVLRQEQEEYQKEGITWTPINYFDNAPVIELIEGQPVGLLKLLDESCLVGQATPEIIVNKFNQFFDKHPHYQSSEQSVNSHHHHHHHHNHTSLFNNHHNYHHHDHSSSSSSSTSKSIFTLKHYAGKVTYDLEHFLAKNRDALHLDILLAVSTSKNTTIQNMFQSTLKAKLASKKIPLTAGQQFTNSINELISILLTCQPHYIRCIKSNDQKKANYFDHERVKDQLRYLNIVETVRVRKAGFSNKLHYNRFFARFKICCKSTWSPQWNKTAKEGVEEIIKTLIPNITERQQQCVFGKKKLFIKSAKTMFLFERVREENLPKAVLTIQKLWRGYKARKWFKAEQRRLQEEKAEIQRMLQRKKAVAQIQSVYIRYKVRRYIGKLAPWTDPPYYNKGRATPNLWKARRQIDDMIQMMHINWWAKVKVSRLSNEQRALVRQKILALDLFGMGYLRKKEWDAKRIFMADYMSGDSNPKKQQFIDAVQKLFPSGEDKEILFADNVVKVNKRGKSQVRTLLITDQHIYKYDSKKYIRKKVGLKIHMIVALSASNKRDTFLAIHFKPPIRDLFIDLGCDYVEKVSEVATILIQQVYKLTRNTVPLLLREPVTFNNSRDSRNSGTDWVVSFAQYEKGKENRLCTFSRGKTNTAIVYYPAE